MLLNSIKDMTESRIQLLEEDRQHELGLLDEMVKEHELAIENKLKEI